jgi:hypothetical protein
MRLKHLILGLLTIVIFSCNNSEKYKPNGLRKVSQSELLEYAEKKQTYNYDEVVYKNESGMEISLDSLKKFPDSIEWTVDLYVNEDNELKELIVRNATEEDKEFKKKRVAAFEKESIDPVIPIKIDCNDIQNILTKVYSLDQNTRQGDNAGDPNIDRENLTIVVSLIEKCGMPTLKEVSKEQMLAIWLVFQHGDNYHRKMYLPQLKKAAQNGDLRKSHMALMEDRILMMDGKPQIYGSQITDDRENGGWKIYDLQNPETVDKRRAEIGMEPLSDYVSQWDIDFNVKQSE